MQKLPRRWPLQGQKLTTAEILLLAMPLCIAAVAVLLILSESWLVAHIAGVGLLAAIAVLCVFAARRSRVGVQTVIAELQAHTLFLGKKLRELEVPVTGSQADAAGGTDHPKQPEALPQLPLPEQPIFENYLRLGAAAPDHRWLDGTILRNASISGRDLLAWRASSRRFTYEGIRAWLVALRDTAREASAQRALAELDVEWSLRLARVLSLQHLEGDDRLNALSLYKFIYDLHGPRSIKPSHTHARVFQALAYYLGEFRLADELSRKLRHAASEIGFIRTDLLNPFGGSAYADLDKWLAAFNENFLSTGLEPLSIDNSPETSGWEPFDRLRCSTDVRIVDGPLVSIVVSSWKPGLGLLTAVQSLLVQSYRNIEVLVIDDCSPDEYLPWLEQVQALDERIRVLRQEVNGGTYMIRNRAIDEARGEFLTFLDSDDWNHPRRIEIQARALQEAPELVYTTSRALRTDPHLVFCLPGVLAQRENASSMMFRRELVRDRVGYFDNVRKGADTEFALRIRAEFGPDSYRIIEQNLSMIRLSQGSLSREEFKPGWRHPSRAVYRRCYEAWHRAHQTQGSSLKTPARMEQRPFAAPLRFLLSQTGEQALRMAELDVVFAADLRFGTDSVRALLAEAAACRDAGKKVAVLHLESFRRLERVESQPFWAPLQDAIDAGWLHEVLTTDSSVVQALVIRDPVVLQFLSDEPFALNVRSLLVVGDAEPVDGQGRAWYEPSACHRQIQRVTGVKPRWIATSNAVQSAWKGALPPASMAAHLLPYVVEVPVGMPRAPMVSRPLVIGRITDAAGPAFPRSHAELMACYPAGEKFEVRMLGGRSECENALGLPSLPPNWIVQDEAEMSHDTFLAACDFLVMFDDRSCMPRRYRAVLEAFASGVVVVLPPRYRDIYRDAARYCEPAEVARFLRDLASSPDDMNQTRQRALAFVRDAAAAEDFMRAFQEALASC